MVVSGETRWFIAPHPYSYSSFTGQDHDGPVHLKTTGRYLPITYRRVVVLPTVYPDDVALNIALALLVDKVSCRTLCIRWWCGVLITFAIVFESRSLVA